MINSSGLFCQLPPSSLLDQLFRPVYILNEKIEGKLKWSSASSTDVLVSDDVQQVETVFTATHKDKRLRLYKKRFKVEEPSNPWLGATSILGHRKYPYWTAQIYLELVDIHGHGFWTFPEVSALSDLLTSVKYQVSGVKDFLNDLLEEQTAEQAD